MRKKWKSFPYLLLGVASLAAIVYMIFFFSPTQQLRIFSLQFSILPIFLLTLFLFLFSLGTYSFKNKIQGILIGLFVVSLLLFRLNNLIHPFFFILLASLFLTLELLFTYKK